MTLLKTEGNTHWLAGRRSDTAVSSIRQQHQNSSPAYRTAVTDENKLGTVYDGLPLTRVDDNRFIYT